MPSSTPGFRPRPPTGAELIAAERQRQIEVEGYTPEHDAGHDRGQIARAAMAYLTTAYRLVRFAPSGTLAAARAGKKFWLWGEGWKPSPDPVRNLVKAGALIAAEIDRLQVLSRLEADRG